MIVLEILNLHKDKTYYEIKEHNNCLPNVDHQQSYYLLQVNEQLNLDLFRSRFRFKWDIFIINRSSEHLNNPIVTSDSNRLRLNIVDKLTTSTNTINIGQTGRIYLRDSSSSEKT